MAQTGMATSFRRATVVAHRWTGLAASIVLVLVGVTGNLLVWDGDTTIDHIAARLHEALGLGGPGARVVGVATVAAVLLEVSGLFLWWKRKAVVVRWRAGWRLVCYDLHHVAGLVGLVVMVMLAATGAAMVVGMEGIDPALKRFIVRLHSGREYAWPVKLVYMAGTTGFVLQGLTGVVMWWRVQGSALKRR